MLETKNKGTHSDSIKTLETALIRANRHRTNGRFEEARAILSELKSPYAEHWSVCHMKGVLEVSLGNKEAGFALIENAMSQNPDNPLLMVDFGGLLAQTGELDRAISIFRMAVEIAPNYEVAHGNLGAALVLKKQYKEAIEHLKKALDLEPGLLDATTNLATAYASIGRFNEAISALYQALSVDPYSIKSHIMLANFLYRRERHDSARHHAMRALEINPNQGEALLALANIDAASGDMESAVKACLKASEQPGLAIAAFAQLSHLRKSLPNSPELALLEKIEGNLNKLNPIQRMNFHMSAGKVYDNLGEHAKAFDNFDAGQAIAKAEFPFDAEKYQQRANLLLSICNQSLIKKIDFDGFNDIQPIFITGMPRSGTTLMDQMFSRHSSVMAGGELAALPQAMRLNKRLQNVLKGEIDANELEKDDFKILGETYHEAAKSEGMHRPTFTDKLPANYLNIGYAALAMPKAKFLILHRHPLDTILSNYFQNFGQNQPMSHDLMDLALSYQIFRRFSAYWSGQLPDRVLVLNYEDVVKNPEQIMKQTLDFVGLPWEAQVLDHQNSSRSVVTASISQVRQPIYTTSVSRWHSYAKYLKPAAELLAPYLSDEDLAYFADK